MEGTRKGRVNEESTSLGEALSARHAAQFVFMRCGKADFTEEVRTAEKQNLCGQDANLDSSEF